MSSENQARLILADGTIFYGTSFGAQKSTSGEVVFNTCMVAYPESLTDPSYCGQILVFTYPLIGNYGIPSDTHNIKDNPFESEKIQVQAVIVSEYSKEQNHWNSSTNLSQWLKENGIPAISDVDTRALTQHLRNNGSMPGKIIIEEDCDIYDPNNHNLVEKVSTKEIMTYGNGKHRIMLIDCGVKHNIIRCFLSHDVTLIRVPWNYQFSKDEYDALFISNGPGDPQKCQQTLSNIRRALSFEKPVWGICLGNQLLALAAGAKTYKMKYGHRGHNQPCLEYHTNRCCITSQNHGFAVDHKALPKDWKPYFINVNDGSCEGIRHDKLPFYSVQFHPEAAGGPTDTRFMFKEFIGMLE